MKKIISLLGLFSISLYSMSQNVGIGTNSPQTKLDIKGGLRTGGLNNFLLYDSLSGKFSWSNSYIWATGPQYLMMHSASAEGLHYANAQLEYLNSTGNPVFFTNWNNGNGYFSKRLGIGRTHPDFPLSFPDSLGEKISLYGDSTYHYGIGIQPYLLQIYSADAATDIAFGHGSSSSFEETVRIKGNGTVGIGTPNPAATLHIMQGSAGGNTTPYGPLAVETNAGAYIGLLTPDAFESGIIFGQNSNNASGGIVYNNPSNPNGIILRTNGNIDRVSVTSTGNVGIGTNNPLVKLHVDESSVLFTAAGDIPGVPGNLPVSGMGRKLIWYPDKAAFRAGFVYGGQWDKDSIGSYSFATGNQTTASGYISTAIGYKTKASGNYSTAMGAVSTASGEVSTAMGLVTIAKAPTSLAIGMYNDISDNPNPGISNPLDRIFQIGNGNSEPQRSNAFTVLRNGKIGIGTTTPGFLLSFPDALGDKVSFWGSSGNNYGIGIQSNQLQIHTDISFSDIVFGFGSSASLTENMRIKGNGNVGIGTNNPLQKLQVAGNICASGTIGSCSDIRYKKDFVPVNGSLSSVLALNGIYYYWKKDEFPDMQFNDKRQLGFSAQEVEKLFPEIVMTDTNGYKSVDYGRLTPVLVEAVKEQQKQINEQQQGIDELKKDKLQMQEQINELKKIVEKLVNK
jgi:Chaperone of endosialidase/Head domain of trimeric autotransporter adhesin